MKLLLSGLLLGSLCAISSRSASSTDVVTQTPADVSVEEGAALNITCCVSSPNRRATFNWKKHPNQDMTNQSQGVTQIKNCSTLTFPIIAREDAGTYFCTVTLEIPHVATTAGNGTVIAVVPRESAEDPGGHHSTKIAIILAVVVVGLLLLIALGSYLTLRIRHAQSVRVIYEVPHVDSEEADMDKHSTGSSTGSSQWCQVPVYESFDYFEGVRSKASG